MQRLIFRFILSICGFTFASLQAQYPEFIVKEIHVKLDLVPSEEMGNQAGYSFRQKGYKGGGFDPQFTHVMLWIQPIRSYPWSEKAHAKFLEDLKKDSLTAFVRNFAMDTRQKQRQGLDPAKHQQVELGMPEIVEIMGYRGLQFSYKFSRNDNQLLNTVKKNRFTARRVILFMDKFIAELNWEYVPDENNWHQVVTQQLNTIQIK